MSGQNEDAVIESHWLNWCRLCAKDDVRGNVKVYTNANVNAWNSVLVMAIRRYFDVHMQLEDELSGVLCKECYTLISELIDFAEHVNKVQAIFEVLRRVEPNKQLDVDVLRRQYGLREGDWTHIIKPVSDIENNAIKQDKVVKENALLAEVVPKQELSASFEAEQLQNMENDDETIVNHLPIEEILVAGWDTSDNTQVKPIKRSRARRQTNKLSKADSSDKSTSPAKRSKLQCKEDPDTAKNSDSIDSVKIVEPVIPKHDRDIDSVSSILDADLATANSTIDYSSGSEREHNGTENSNTDVSSKRRNMKCSWCGKLYHNPGSYQKHLRDGCRKNTQRRPKIDRNAYCELCNKTLSSAAALKLHKEGIHENAKPYICDTCGKQLKTITALNEHKLVHTEERPFSCAICRAGFKNRARLKVHHQIHEEPSYVCSICGKKLQTRRTWNMHKLVHSEERKFKCDVCGALFKRSKTLKTHLLSHTGLRPYVCNYCGQTFACNANCRAHKMKKHSQELKKDEGEGLISRLSVPTLKELRVMSQKLPKANSETTKYSS